MAERGGGVAGAATSSSPSSSSSLPHLQQPLQQSLFLLPPPSSPSFSSSLPPPLVALLFLVPPPTSSSPFPIHAAAMASFIWGLLLTIANAEDKLVGFRKMEIMLRLWEMSYNIMVEMLMGRRYRVNGKGGEKEEDGRRLRHMLLKVIEVCGLSMVDMMPWLKWFSVGWSRWRKVVKT